MYMGTCIFIVGPNLGLLLFLVRNDNYAMEMFDSIETKNGKTYEVMVLGFLKVTIKNYFNIQILYF